MIVVKAGGRVLETNMRNILDSVAKRRDGGVVFVHGGGDIVSKYEKMLGIEPKIVTSPSGIRSRLTDERELEVYNMVMAGKLGKEMSAYLNHRGVKAVSLSGVDSALIRATRKKRIVIVDERGRKRAIDGGYTGTISAVDTSIITNLTEMGYVIVVSPVALGDEGEMLNVDGDTAASAIASALKAEKLILLTDVEGVLLDGRLVESLTVGQAQQLLEQIGAGMNRKLMAAAKAVENGVVKAYICSGMGEDPLKRVEGGKATIITGL
ncbi:Acetylglutamate kinase [archaeon HR01]|nr:Acetylglutamate kinase [archaeon HR01]